MFITSWQLWAIVSPDKTAFSCFHLTNKMEKVVGHACKTNLSGGKMAKSANKINHFQCIWVNLT